MPSLDSWIDVAELRELAGRVTSEAAPSPVVEQQQNANWSSQLEKLKAQATSSGLIREAPEAVPVVDPRGTEERTGHDQGSDLLSRAGEIQPRAKDLLGASNAFFCDAARQSWPAEEAEALLVETGSRLAETLSPGAFGGQWIDSKSGMFWVFNSVHKRGGFWLGVFTRRAATHENLQFIAEAVRILGERVEP
ncbi:MAG: hypothetical protein AAGJ79_05560 [Verrucomicrobiota bacterium]